MLQARKRSGDHRAAVPVLPLVRGDASGEVVVRALDTDTAARVVRTFGECSVQVNEAVAPCARAAVARHCLETHQRGCYTAHCLVAREWLRAPGASDVTAASA